VTVANRTSEERTRELGLELFERARSAMPSFVRRAWWQQRALEYFSAQPALQTQLFRFMETVPHLSNDADIAAHLKEYLDPQAVRMPLPLRFVTLYDDPKSAFGRGVGRLVKTGALQMATAFVTGTNTQEAIANAVELRRRHMAFTLDVLGEATISERQADHAAAVYEELITSLGAAAKTWPRVPQIDDGRDGPMPRANVSIKLSALDPVFNPVEPQRVYDAVAVRLRPLLLIARRLNVFVNIDMESYKYRDLTLEVFKRLLEEPDFHDWSDVGIVVQAYLQDSSQDLAGLLEWVKRRGTGIAIRLVKGAYWDTETTHAVRANTRIPVWTRKWESDASYERLARVMLAHAELIRPAFASHNVRTLASVMATAEACGLSPRDYELQMLAGMGEPLKTAVVGMGRCLRVYCPYGDLLQGMAYLIRRLLENTSNDSFLKQGFRDRGSYERLLANPADARPPSAPLPRRHYVDTFEDAPMNGFTNAVNMSFGSAAHREKFAQVLAEARHHLGAKVPLTIHGAGVETGAWIESTNPADPAEVIGRAAKGDVSCADRAVAAASKALPQWSGTSVFDRAAILRRAAELLEERRLELAAALTLEIAKNPVQADAEITEAIDYCNYHAGLVEHLARRPRRRNVPGEENVLVYDPCGVCVLIGSWDFPVALLAGMVSAATAVGNTVVIKPSSKAPLAALKLVRILEDAGFPAGVVNCVPGDGAVLGRYLVEHEGVHLVAFCGSSAAARDVLGSAAKIRPGQRHIKRAIVDAGAKNAIIVDHDVDVDEAVLGVLESAFAFSGQKCTSCSRVIVLEDLYERFNARLAEAASVMRIGDPADAGTVIGPVIDAASATRICQAVDAARKSARVLFEAKRDKLPARGHYVAPIILADVDPQSPLAQEELFGPVLTILRARDFDHALHLANDCAYALTGGLYSRSPAHIERVKHEFRVGNLYINRKITGSQVDVQPYGGSKLSGDGARLGGPDYLLQYCRPRTISENTIRHGLTGTPEGHEAAVPAH
jgi:RHH-type proline utilization regulon transcriptional repressor/proline dehydrogenase/delta 1-pyrroline-5-carboxylate dehydrogenase